MPKVSDKRETERGLEIFLLRAVAEGDYELADRIATCLYFSLGQRYINERVSSRDIAPWDITELMSELEHEFKQAVRVSKSAFVALFHRIKDHAVFHNNSNIMQLPVGRRLAIVLEILGSNGTGARIGKFRRNVDIGRGTVIKVTRRVIEAIHSLQAYLVWPSAQRRAEISAVMEREGFRGCIGFVDGTGFPLHQRPGKDGEVFHDRKRRYSINAQIICGCDKRITALYTGWPGSCADSTILNKMELARNPQRFFSDGQFLLADFAYALTGTVIPSFKGREADELENAEYNNVVAKSRVRNEHCIGILKGRWSSLRELRLHLDKDYDMQPIVNRIVKCAILHKMLADLGDEWHNMYLEDEDYAYRRTNIVTESSAVISRWDAVIMGN